MRYNAIRHTVSDDAPAAARQRFAEAMLLPRMARHAQHEERC
jgi:hypothetical protein